MSEVTNNEAVEATEVVEVSGKVGVLTKVKGFCKKHKKGLIVGSAVAAVAAGLITVLKKAGNDVDYDYDSYDEDEFVESDAEEVSEDGNEDVE